MKTIKLFIDLQEVFAKEGDTILEAARKADIKIPTLCAFEQLKPYGSCRLCIVEIEGKKGFQTSCTTLVQENMRVYTQSEQINKIRRNILELYLSEHDFECTTCAKNLRCELQEVASLIGIRQVRYNSTDHVRNLKDSTNPYFEFDTQKCIMCARCTRACEEIEGNFALTIISRGFDSQISPGLKELINSECVSCGACVKACPTGALIEKNIVNLGSGNKFTNTTCGFCGVGCQIVVESKANTIVNVVGDDEGPNKGHLCVKGRFAWEFFNSNERIKKPMIRERLNETFREVSWEEALDFVGGNFLKIKEKYSKYALAALASSRCTNEEVYLVQKLARCAFENNNVDNCARVCHMPTGFALGAAYGTGAGTADIDSLREAECVMIVGSNTTHAHPVIGSLIKSLARLNKKIIIIDPRRIELAKSPHVNALHLQLTPGTNVALLNAIAHTIVTENLYNEDFIKERCDSDSFQYWLEFIKQPQNAPEEIEKITQVSAQLIKEAARIYAKSEKSTIVYGLGVTEHAFGSTGVFCLTNLAMLCGHIGKNGCGISPLRGQNNVQGASDMGAFPNVYTFYRHISDTPTKELFERVWQKKLDSTVGLTIPQMFNAAIEGRLKAMYIVGEDVFQTDPDINHVAKALSSLEFLVVQELFLSKTTQFAHVILPGSSYLEKDGTFTNWERRISLLKKAIKPLSGFDEYKIMIELSKRLGYPMDYNSPEEVFNEIARVSPQLEKLTYEKLNLYKSLLWPVNTTNPLGTNILHSEEFLNKKGKFFITKYRKTRNVTQEFPFILTTGRNLFQYNSGNQTRRSHNNIFYGSDVLEINPDDARKLQISENGLVDVSSKKATVTFKARITDKIPSGIVYTTFHFPEYPTNALTTQNLDWAVDTPEYKITPVNLKKSQFNKILFTPTTVDDNIEDDAMKVYTFFEDYPRQLAVNYTLNHIKRTWDPYKISKLKELSDTELLLKEIIEKL